MSRHFNFIAPKPNKILTGAARVSLGTVLRFLKIRRVIYSPQAIELLRTLDRERLVLCPNHPTNTEPAILFGLAAEANQEFHYVCCREAFGYWGGFYGWLIRRFGAYSLVRGALDRSSFQCTRQLLTRPGVRIVIFPEGEVYSQNDSLLPFQSGVIQLCYWGLEDARKSEPSADVLLVPVAVHYRFLKDMGPVIKRSLARLERAVGLEVCANDSPLDRLKRLGDRVLSGLEHSYTLRLPDGLGLQERMDAVKDAILVRAAKTVGVEPKGATLVERMRYVINAAHQVTLEQPASDNAYDRKLWEEHRTHVEPTIQDLDRLANWIAVYDGYVASDPSQERVVQTIRRLEMEVFGKMICNGPQECRLEVGEPVSLRSTWSEYSQDKRQTVADVTDLVEGRVQDVLQRIGGSESAEQPYDRLGAGV